jgi:hypothetical protein
MPERKRTRCALDGRVTTKHEPTSGPYPAKPLLDTPTTQTSEIGPVNAEPLHTTYVPHLQFRGSVRYAGCTTTPGLRPSYRQGHAITITAASFASLIFRLSLAFRAAGRMLISTFDAPGVCEWRRPIIRRHRRGVNPIRICLLWALSHLPARQPLIFRP